MFIDGDQTSNSETIEVVLNECQQLQVCTEGPYATHDRKPFASQRKQQRHILTSQGLHTTAVQDEQAEN